MNNNEAREAASRREIMELVKLLRENGDKVLSASSKLSLSTSLLYNLNEAFTLIVDEPEDLDSSFRVCNSSKIDVFRNLKFLHDFVQKTVGLKLVSGPTEPRLPVDITKFRHLKYLELKKVSIESVRGLQGIRGQLEVVICAGRNGVPNVNQLLAACGGDAGVGFVWASLRHLALPHNALEKLDASVELAPWLQVLDLSHNLISSADELASLSNLKYVNLGYNRLERVPVFNKAALHSLQVLVLKHNYIENIHGLQGLESLTELDLSFNCLTDHSILWPVQKMSTLSWMSLEGNPLAYHTQHRLLAIRWLHPCLSDSKFVLDHLPLSRSEKRLIAENRPSGIMSDQLSGSREYLASVTSSMNSSILSGSSNATVFSEHAARRAPPPELTDSLERSVNKSAAPGRRKKNVREAIIAEDELERKETKADSDILSSSYLETSKDHLETKKQILALREKFGETNWLSSHAGTFVQDIMGLPQSEPAMVTGSVMKGQYEASPGLFSGDHQPGEQPGQPSKDGDADDSQESAQEETRETSDEVINGEETSTDLPGIVATVSEPAYDPEEETGDLYLVQKRKNADELEQLFLVITPDNIKERDTITGKVRYCWSTSSVLSCVLGRSEPITVDIIFDTTREDRQNRRYLVEPDDAKSIVATIGERIKKRPIQLKVYKCMKCSTHFSQDTEYTSGLATSVTSATQLKCPTCRSTLVIQTDELTTSDAETDTRTARETSSEPRSIKESPEAAANANPNLQHSESYSSIGGTEGGAISVTTSLVHSDSRTQAQVCCSATSLEESRESTPSTNALNKKYDSDIEILSNPSQSSIEVLDEASKAPHTPHRKRSSEERRTAVAPSLLTIPDASQIMTGLTESSSSGSLTDSICTAYENKTVKPSSSADEKSRDGSEKEAKLTPVTNLTSMLGGLLQSIKIGSNNKSPPLKPEEGSQYLGGSIQYSYTDFSSVDHRVKLHVILNIFEHENEELVLLLRADMLLPSVKDVFPGCLVLSTSKVYVLKIDGPEGEDPQRWLHKEVSWTTDRLRSFAPLPFKQGVVIELQQPNKPKETSHGSLMLLCLLQDFQRTSNFLFYITDLQLPPSCEVDFLVPEHCTGLMHNLLKSSTHYRDDDTVRLLALFSSGELRYQEVIQTRLKLSSLIVTASVLVILEDDVHWLLPGTDRVPGIAREQPLSNLIAIEHSDPQSLTLNFLDEVAGLEESWTLNFVSRSAAEAVINSVQPPWEELFSVPLQINSRRSSNSSNNSGVNNNAQPIAENPT